MIKKFVKGLAISSAIFITACGPGASSNATPHNAEDSIQQNDSGLAISHVSTIPIVNGRSVSLPLIVSSNVDEHLDFSNVNGNINALGCSNGLSKGGRCSITYTSPTVNSNEPISISFKNKNGKVYTVQTIVSSQAITESSTDGFIYFPTNTSMISTNGADNSHITPVVLGTNFKTIDVKSSSQKVDSTLICDANSFNKGNFCYITSIAKDKEVYSKIQLTGISETDEKITGSMVYEVKSTGGQSIPFLMLGTTSLLINLANGASKKEMTILNIGNTAARVTIEPSNQDIIEIEKGTCTTIESGGQCTIKLTANSALSGSETVTVKYSGGSVTEKVINFNVYYVGDPNAVLALEQLSNLDLTGTSIDNHSVIAYRITNTGKTTVDKITFTKLSASDGFNYLNAYPDIPADQICTTDGEQILIPKQSCVLPIKYKPTKVEGGNDLTVYMLGRYKNEGNSYATLKYVRKIPYSSYAPTANLGIIRTPSHDLLSIVTNAAATELSFTVQNSGDYPAKITDITPPTSSGNISINAKTRGAKACAENTTIEPKENCSLTYNVSASQDVNQELVSLSLSYTPRAAQADKIATNQLRITSTTTKPTIGITSPTVEIGNTYGATKTSNKNYVNTPRNNFKVTYTFSNSNSATTAKDFYIDTNSLPAGVIVDPSSNCSYGVVDNNIDLTTSKNCTLVLTSDQSLVTKIRGQISLSQIAYFYKYGDNNAIVMDRIPTDNDIVINLISPYAILHTVDAVNSTRESHVVNFLVTKTYEPVSLDFSKDLYHSAEKQGFEVTADQACSIGLKTNESCTTSFKLKDKQQPDYLYKLPYKSLIQDTTMGYGIIDIDVRTKQQVPEYENNKDLMVFVTKTAYKPNFAAKGNAYTVADQICMNDANHPEHGVDLDKRTRKFMMWIDNREATHAGYNYKTASGRKVFTATSETDKFNWSTPLAGSELAANFYLVATGVKSNCSNWTTTSSREDITAGAIDPSINVKSTAWNNVDRYRCDNQYLHFYCVEQPKP